MGRLISSKFSSFASDYIPLPPDQTSKSSSLRGGGMMNIRHRLAGLFSGRGSRWKPEIGCFALLRTRLLLAGSGEAMRTPRAEETPGVGITGLKAPCALFGLPYVDWRFFRASLCRGGDGPAFCSLSSLPLPPPRVFRGTAEGRRSKGNKRVNIFFFYVRVCQFHFSTWSFEMVVRRHTFTSREGK